MNVTKENIDEWMKEIDAKLPFSKYLGYGLYQVFDGKSSFYMGKELYEQFEKLLQQEGEKYKI